MIWAIFTNRVFQFGAAVALVLAVLFIAYKTVKKQGEDSVGREVAETVIERTKEAKDAREEIGVNGSVLYNQCLRSSRTPENCKRFMPDLPAGER